MIVSEVLPKEFDNFSLFNGIWVTSPRSTLGLATALREQVINFRFLKQSTVGMYGDMKGIIGKTLPEIKQLSLESGDE